MRCVDATFDFAGAESGQLAFAAGDVIEITQQGGPDEWWEGRCHGATGWFPSNFCSPPYEVAGAGGDTPASYAGGPSLQTAVALYAFAASAPDELSFAAGDVIDVFDSTQEWWTGSAHGATGVFPGNFGPDSTSGLQDRTIAEELAERGYRTAMVIIITHGLLTRSGYRITFH